MFLLEARGCRKFGLSISSLVDDLVDVFFYEVFPDQSDIWWPF